VKPSGNSSSMNEVGVSPRRNRSDRHNSDKKGTLWAKEADPTMTYLWWDGEIGGGASNTKKHVR
jgi:hypothetical protein